MSNQEGFQKFLFEQLHIRGEWVRLEDSFQAMVANHDYPGTIRALLAQTTAAALLLTGTLKFSGRLSIHARGNGAISLLMAEATDQRHFRAIAKYDDEQSLLSTLDLRELLGRAQMAITIEPEKGQRYQGVGPLEYPDMSACLEQYFELSEQLDTHFTLVSDERGVYGLMLQKLPDYRHLDDQDAWDRVVQLAKTLTLDEFAQEDNATLTHRLFHEEEVRLFDMQSVAFQCSCSEQRSLDSLRALGQEEALAILEEEPVISVDCQFCNAHYEFDRSAVESLFAMGKPH